MTKFLGWVTSCGAVVTSCQPSGSEPNAWAVTFDRLTRDSPQTSVFLIEADGTHYYRRIGKLQPPGDPVNAAKRYKLNGEPATILTTQALGDLPVIVRGPSGVFLSFSRFGRGEAGILEAI